MKAHYRHFIWKVRQLTLPSSQTQPTIRIERKANDSLAYLYLDYKAQFGMGYDDVRMLREMLDEVLEDWEK